MNQHSRLSAEQRHARGVKEFRVWKIPDAAFEFGFIRDIMTESTHFSQVCISCFKYVCSFINQYLFHSKNKKIIMSGNFKCLSKVLGNNICLPKFAFVSGSQPSCGDAKGFLEVAKASNYYNIKIYLLNSQI